MAQLYKACQVSYDRNLSLVEQLLAEGMDPNYRGSDGDTCLHRAAYYNSPLTVDALVNAGAHPHARVNECESMFTYATPMYFACFYGPHTVCPLIRADIRHYGLKCILFHPAAYIHNIFIGATYGVFCLCCFQTIPQLTDCSKTWRYCIEPCITFPVVLSENCSFNGIKVARIMPEISEEEKALRRLQDEIANMEKGGEIKELTEAEKFKAALQKKKSSKR